jgi:VWFA-related protein
MLIDDLHLYRQRTDRAKAIAKDAVSRLGAGATMAVLFTSGDRSTELTRDRRSIVEAIDQLVGRRPVPRPSFAPTPGGMDEPGIPNDIQNFYNNLATVRAMREAARLLKTDAVRRKAFVLISEWMPGDLTGLFQAMAPPGKIEGGEAYIGGNLEAFPKPEDFSTIDYELTDMIDTMRRSNVVTYAIDPRGAVSTQQLMRECFPQPRLTGDLCMGDNSGGGRPPDWSNWVRQAQHGLEISTAASGGFAITNTDDFTGGLERILEDLDHYYLLGFYPADPERRSYRRIELKVNRPGLTLRYRHGYQSGPPRELAPTSADPLMALTTGVVPKSGLPLRLAAMPMTNPGVAAVASLASRATRVDVALEVSVPVEKLAGANGLVADTIRYTVLAANLKDGKVAAQFTNTANVSSTSPLKVRPGTVVPYQLPVELSLMPGRYQLRAAVASNGLGESGSVYLTVDVPDLSKPATVMSALVLGYADGPRLPITTGAASKSALPFTPTLAREFRIGETLRLYFETQARMGTIARVTVEILDHDERAVRTWRPAVTPEQTSVNLPIPLEGLAAGQYGLRVTVVGYLRVTRDLAFRIR